MQPNRGMFGYEGEGFDQVPEPRPPSRSSVEVDPARGWNIGSEDDHGESHPHEPEAEQSDRGR